MYTFNAIVILAVQFVFSTAVDFVLLFFVSLHSLISISMSFLPTMRPIVDGHVIFLYRLSNEMLGSSLDTVKCKNSMFAQIAWSFRFDYVLLSFSIDSLEIEIEKKFNLCANFVDDITHFQSWIHLNLWAFSFPMLLKMTNERRVRACVRESIFHDEHAYLYVMVWRSDTGASAHKTPRAFFFTVGLEWIALRLLCLALSSHIWQFNSAHLNGKFK